MYKLYHAIFDNGEAFVLAKGEESNAEYLNPKTGSWSKNAYRLWTRNLSEIQEWVERYDIEDIKLARQLVLGTRTLPN